MLKKLKPVKKKYKAHITLFFDHIDKKEIELVKNKVNTKLEGKLNYELDVYLRIKLKFVKH